MLECDTYGVGILDETKVKPYRFTGFGCKDYDVIPHITMRNCDGYYFNGQVYYTKGGILHQDYRYGSDSYGYDGYGSTHYGSYGYESYGSTGYGAYGYDGYLHHDTSGGSIDSFTGTFTDNLGRRGTFTFKFDTNDTTPTHV